LSKQKPHLCEQKNLAVHRLAPNRARTSEMNQPQSATAFSIYRHDGTSFPVLPDGMSRENLVAIINRAAPLLRLGSGALRAFALMVGKTRPSDFTDPRQEPCCYAAQVELAKEFGMTDRQLRNHEAALLRAGLIEKRVMANGARSGFHGCGIYFSAAIALVPRLVSALGQQEESRRHAAVLRGRRSTHLRHITGALDELRPGFGQHPQFQTFAEELAAWPAASKLHRLPLDRLEAHESEAATLYKRVLSFLANHPNTSAGPEEIFRPYIQDTTQDSDLSCNASVSDRTSGKPEDAVRFAASPEGSADCDENKDRTARADHKNEFMEKLSPKRLYRLCSPDMQMQVDLERGERSVPTAHDFECAAVSRLPELGINISAWHEAVRHMGPQAATICVLLTDAKATDPGSYLRSPGGYLRALTKAHRNGTLNIIGGLMGLNMKRDDHES
jgi:replication initiation protein RepC